MTEYPTPWQRKMMWAALTACFVLLLVVVLGAVIWAAANVISFLQPILIPVAIAAILTYLLDPLVTKMSRGTLSRTKAVALVFAIGFFALGGLGAWLVPTISIQSANFARQVPAYTDRARDYMVDLSIRPHIRVTRRSAREIGIDKLNELAHWPRGISFSSGTTDSDSDRVASSHCVCDRNDCPKLTKVDHC